MKTQAIEHFALIGAVKEFKRFDNIARKAESLLFSRVAQETLSEEDRDALRNISNKLNARSGPASECIREISGLTAYEFLRDLREKRRHGADVSAFY